MKRSIFVVIALVFTLTPAFAQFHDDGNVHAEVNFTAGIPHGDFDGHIDGEAVGISALVGGPVPESPLILASEIGYLNYSTASRLSLHSTVFDDGIDEDLAIPLEAVNTKVSNNIFLGHLVVRLQPLNGIFQPYLDALAGVKFFDTRLRVESDVVIFSRGLSQEVHIIDFAFSYGVGGGFELQIYEHESLWSDAAAKVSLHGGLRYLFGTTAKYAAGSSIREIDGSLAVDEVESHTDLLMPQFGIRVRH